MEYQPMDPLVDQEALKSASQKNGVLLHTFKYANHSLETGNVLADLENLRMIMRACQNFIS